MAGAHWTDIIFEMQTDPRLITDRPDIYEPADVHFFQRVADTYAKRNPEYEAAGMLDWSALMLELSYAAMAEGDPETRRGKLMRVAALAVSWSDAIALRGIEDA